MFGKVIKKRQIWLLLSIIFTQVVLGSSDSELQKNSKPTTKIDRLNLPWSRNNKTNQDPHFKVASTLKNSYDGGDVTGFAGFERHPCRRVCMQGQSQVCYYQLVVHNYWRLGPECRRCQNDERVCAAENCIYGDGISSPAMVMNRMLPGPSIELCENDTVVVDVLNYLNEPSTIHWHGIHMSRSPEMDGVAYVTQYPIQPSQAYRYEFLADRSGSLFYHSHMGWQRGLGVAGNLIIRQPHQSNLHARLYDYDLVEHALMIQDIFYDFNFQQVRNILINGRGRNHLSQFPDQDSNHRYDRVRVTSGYRYRFRVIYNGALNCPVEFSIEDHKLLIISADGNDIEPVLADGFFLTSAERFDFVLEANQYTRNYWIRIRGYEQCEDHNIYQGAILSYRGASRTGMPQSSILYSSQVKEFNNYQRHINDIRYKLANYSLTTPRQTNSDVDVGTVSLRSLSPLQWNRYTQFSTYYISLSRRQAPNGEELFQIDDISYNSPDISLLQGRHLYQDDHYFCNSSSLAAKGRNCARDICECTNVIRLPADRPIELVITNLMEATHPIHLHGYIFRVVGQSVLGKINDLRNIRALDNQGLLDRLPSDYPAVAKDTVQVPGLGYVIIRFISNNPGFWSFHCHIESHAVQGMGAVLKIGEDFQMKRIPAKISC